MIILPQKVGQRPPFYFIRNMDVIEKIRQAIEPSLDDMGYTIVLLRLMDGARRKTLQVMAERKDETGMSFDDCTDISRTVGALLEVEDPITGAYDLEVCSPGLDRPLTRLSDFTRYAGYEAKIEAHIPIDGRKRFKGTIGKTKGETIHISMPEGEVDIPHNNIRTAKLVMTETLLKTKEGKK